jgi:hypothetical protein
MTDQSIYYNNKFEGEWKCQKKERFMKYQFAGFAAVLFVSFLIGLYLDRSLSLLSDRNSAGMWMIVVLGLDLIFYFLEYDV